MSYKGRIVRGKKESERTTMGVFGVQGRIPAKIAKQQIAVAQNLTRFFKKLGSDSLTLGQLHQNAKFVIFLGKMLNVNPRLRKSPDDLIEEEFL